MHVNQLGKAKVDIGIYKNGMKYKCHTKHARREAHSHIQDKIYIFESLMFLFINFTSSGFSLMLKGNFLLFLSLVNNGLPHKLPAGFLLTIRNQTCQGAREL